MFANPVVMRDLAAPDTPPEDEVGNPESDA
jgi:hypothetical protein